MNYKEYSGKDETELLNQASEELNIPVESLIVKKTVTKGGLLKKDTVNLSVATLDDVVAFVKDYLASITKDMGLDVSFESKIRDNQIIVKMYSDHNNILIGRNGQTLKALTTVVKQVVYNEINEYPYLILDVENYKEKQVKYLERLAKNIAREVANTKNPVELENMNSYERRVIHNILTDNKYVYTESVGEEPNRHVVVKPKED